MKRILLYENTITTTNGSKIIIKTYCKASGNAWQHISTRYNVYSCEELTEKDLEIVKEVSGNWYTTYTGKGLSFSDEEPVYQKYKIKELLNI